MSGLPRPTGFGRAGGIESLIERQETAERRLASSLRQAEAVNSALGTLDQQLADVGAADEAEILRASARALLVVAFRQKDYDVTLLPASCDFRLRVRNTTSGLQAEVTDAAETVDGKDEDTDPRAADEAEVTDATETLDGKDADPDIRVADGDD